MSSEILGILFAGELCGPGLLPLLHTRLLPLAFTLQITHSGEQRPAWSSFITVPTALHQTLNQWCWGSRLEENLPVNNQRCQHPTLSSHPSKVFPTLSENPGHGTICHKGQGALWRIKTHRYNENLGDNYATSPITAFGFWYPSYPINFQVSSINRWAIIETSLYECKVVVSRYKIKHKF